MSVSDTEHTEKRACKRRFQDRRLREQLDRYKLIFQVGQIITSEMDMEKLFPVIMDQTNIIMETDRSSVFVHDEKTDTLWSLAATGMDKAEIRIPADHGIAGWVFKNRKPLIINDPYKDHRFYAGIDRNSDFRTRNILCMPLINRDSVCIGAIQALNKKSGTFMEEDQEILLSISHYVTVALENSRLYEDLKAMNKAKERVVNHLAHELKTPLAVISGVFDTFSKKIPDKHIPKIEKALMRGRRNVDRLHDLQDRIDDILNQRSDEEMGMIVKIIEDAASLVGEMQDQWIESHSEILESISGRLRSIYSREEILREDILLDGLLNDICDTAIASMGERDIDLIRKFEKGLTVHMDRNVLKKVFGGLLRNAVENTPDGGIIEIKARPGNGDIRVEFHDRGIGITEINQKIIFGGFFHTQDTGLYSSKTPYAFAAGGTGSDLLRIKALSERLGFSVTFSSTRCGYIPEDTDECPGKISECRHITQKTECRLSGGSTFSVILKRY